MSAAFFLLLASATFRVIAPLFNPTNYVVWLGLSQILWIASFLIFVVVFFPILSRPRIDGRAG
jgi:uncharacterized protein involved in response to NO